MSFLKRLFNRAAFIPLFYCVLFANISFAQTDPQNTPSFELAVGSLAQAKLKEVATIASTIGSSGDPRAIDILQNLLEGQLYFIKESERIVVAVLDPNDKKRFIIEDALSKEALGSTDKKSIKKIRTNNRLRGNLRTAIAKLSLSSPDVDLRIAAVEKIMEKMNDTTINLLTDARTQEKNSDVLEAIDIALAVGQIDAGDEAEKIAAVAVLKGNLEPVVRNKLSSLAETSQSPKVKAAAEDALKSIETKIKFYGYVETLFFGLSLGSVLLLVAAGLAITFGVMGVINMAHGEMIMLGAYTTYVVQLLMPNHIEYSIFVAIPAAFIVSGFFGILIERGVIQFLKGRPLETLLATFGISLILQQLVRTVFSPLNREVITPEFMSGALEINSVFSITYNRLYILGFALVVFFALQLILKKTSLGLNVRAVSQNRDMAKAMGIRTEWVDAMTFGLGSGIAGLAGVALSQITNVGPNLGQAYIIDSFMVVVFGGVGNLWGTLVGGFSLGVLNKFLEPATGAVLANIIVLVGIILFIQKRPRGLFPQKGRAAES